MPSRPYAQKTIQAEMTVRQIATDFPASQDVFRSYGEPDAPPARFGHLEPLTHFARRQGVPLEKILSELAAATGAPIEQHDWFADRVHQGFLLAALALTLTLGAGWGGWLLWCIGAEGQFNAAPAAYVIAHGEAQLWGFIVFFVMGVSLRTVMQGATRRRFGRWICYGLLLLGSLGVVGGMLWSVYPGTFAWLGVASGGAFCLMALGLWSLQIGLLRSKWRATWARAVMISGLWLIAWAVVTVWLRWNAGASGPSVYSDSQRLLIIALAVFGFTMNSIYGFGQMLLPGLLRIGSTRDWAIELSHWLHNAGTIVVCLATVFVASGLSMVFGSVLVVSGAILFAVGHRGFVGRRRTSHGAEKGHASLDFYPPLAFFWLVTALVLMTGGVMFEAAEHKPLPHAYMGSVRHALTVGFMTTLILGVGQRIVPVLDRTVLAMPRLTLPILVLIGFGNLLRVGTELATIVTPAAYVIMPLSAVMEWSALMLFALNITATVFHKDPLLKQGRVTNRSSLAVLVAQHPWIEDLLRPTGTRYLERARSVPDELTIGSFANSEGLDAVELVSKINAWLVAGRPIGGNGSSPTGGATTCIGKVMEKRALK
jgi:hypothetical protein